MVRRQLVEFKGWPVGDDGETDVGANAPTAWIATDVLVVMVVVMPVMSVLLAVSSLQSHTAAVRC